MIAMNQTEIINTLVSFGYSDSHAIDLYKKYSDEDKLEYLIEYIDAKKSDNMISSIEDFHNILSDR